MERKTNSENVAPGLLPDPIVGDAHCKFTEVCNALKNSPAYGALVPKINEIAIQLKIDGGDANRIKRGLATETKTDFEALHEILSSWRAKFTDNARLSVLLEVLKHCGVGGAAENLEEHFKTKRKHVATYSSAPNGMTEFLNSEFSVLVICSMDKHVTAAKLVETGSSAHMHDHTDFDNNLLVSKSKDQVYSVDCSNEVTLSELLSLIDPTIKCRAVLITEEKLEDVQRLCSGKRHIMLTRDTLQWSHLSPAKKRTISGNCVKVSGKLISFREVANTANVWNKLDEALDESTLIELVHDKQPSILVKSVPEPINYYVARRVSSRTLLKSDEIFKMKVEPDAKAREKKRETKEQDNVFVFTGLERPELSRYASPNSTDTTTNQKRMDRPTVKYMVLDLKSDFDELAEKVGGPLHWINHKAGKFYWVKSAGRTKTFDAIQKAVDTRSAQEEYSEDRFLDLLLQTEYTSSQPVLISDTPGMGKTMLMANLARQLESKGEVVLFGVMSNLVKKLKPKLKSREINPALVDLLSSLGGDTSPLAREYLKHSFNSNSDSSPKINVMLDGFDEVPSQDFELAVEILELIRSNAVARLWVSTRPHLLEGLENCLQVLGHNILPFKPEDQRQCLVAYWQDGERSQDDKLQKYASVCLETLHLSMRSSDHDITGVPLQCMLIGELYEREARNFAKPDNLTIELFLPSIYIRSVADLYKRLLEKNLDKYFERYSSNKYDKEQLKLAHMYFSIQLLFPGWTDKLDEILGPGRRVELEDVLNVGLLEMVGEEGLPEFIHRTVAEFFAALFVVDHLIEKGRVTREKKDVVAQLFISSVLECESFREGLDSSRFETPNLHSYRFRHGVVLYFLDNLIQTESKQRVELVVEPKQLTHACATGNLTRLFHYLLRTRVFHDDIRHLWNTDLAFVSVRYSDVELISTICKKYDEAHDGTSVVRDLRLKLIGPFRYITLLDVAVIFREYSVVEHLINCQGFKDLVSNHDESVRNVIHYCVEDSRSNDTALIREKMQTLQLLCGFNPLLIEHKNYLRETPLLCSYVHVKLLCQLINLGANVMGFHEYDNNLLHKAAEYLSPEDYHELVTRIPQDSLSKLVRHKSMGGRIPLHIVMEYFDPNDSTLQLFKDAGADYNSVDEDEVSVIAVAVRRKRRISTIEQLIIHGAVWRNMTSSGWSVLHDALEYFNFPVFQHFALKLTEDLHIQQQLRDAADWSGLGDLNLQALGINVNAKHPYGNTLLYRLVESFILYAKDTRNVIRILLQSGIDKRATNNSGVTVLDQALMEWCEGFNLKNAAWILNTLLSHGAVYSPSEAYDSLKTIVENMALTDHEEIDSVTERILDACHLTLSQTDENGDTLLHHAAYANNERGAEYLLSKGVDMNARNKRGETPAHKVASMINEHLDPTPTIQLLTEHGGELTAVDNDGRTPLEKAIENRRGRIIESLFSTGAYDELELLQRVLHHCDTHPSALDFEEYGTLLHAAGRTTKDSIFEFLLEEEGFLLTDPQMNDIVHIVVSDTARNDHEDIQAKVRMLQLIKSKNPALLNSRDSKNRTPLLCEYVHVDLLIWLLDNGEDPAAVDEDEQNVFHIFADRHKPHEFLRLVEWAGKHGFEGLLNAEDIFQNTAAIDFELEEQTLEMLLKYFNIQGTNNNGVYCLPSVELGNRICTFLQMRINKGEDCTITNQNRQTIMCFAADKGNVDALQMFISKGMGVNDKDEKGFEPIHYAAAAGNIHVLKLLIENECDVDARNKYGGTPLHQTVLKSENGKWQEALEFLIEQGADVYAKDNQGQNMLHYAAQSRNPDEYHAVLEWVVRNSYERLFKGKSNNQNTPLQSAVCFTEIGERTLDFLLKYNEINEINNDGDNALFYAVQGNRNAEFIKLLISKGAEWKNTNNDQDTVLHFAATWGSVDALRFFIEKGCDVNARNKNDETVLHCAFKGERFRDGNDDEIQASTHDMVKLLLENNADVDAKDSEGRTPIGVAVEKFEAGKVDSETIELMEIDFTQRD